MRKLCGMVSKGNMEFTGAEVPKARGKRERERERERERALIWQKQNPIQGVHSTR